MVVVLKVSEPVLFLILLLLNIACRYQLLGGASFYGEYFPGLGA